MKTYVVTGLCDGGFAFSFCVNCYNSFQAIQLASKDELVKDMKFDKLILKEIEKIND
ncbi:MAG: hypothetical protein K6F12_05230 [Streptococcus sp.]|uniref:hypothetical protein n=1 Tax=Streptococcus sp. TaxID=1306 RepID=UPI002585FBB5|nr:hypothetical protein [Streptococcus sp.]MCR5493051.1 hypothetical protein [Streptococcus sp.]